MKSYDLQVEGMTCASCVTRVEKLVNKFEPAGNYEVEFKSDNLPSGVYLYKLQADDYKATKKMILLKWVMLIMLLKI